MKYKVLFVMAVVMLLSAKLVGQQVSEDTVVLEQVKVFSTRLADYGLGNKKVSLSGKFVDMQHQANLSQLLTHYSGLNIRSYGTGGLSTVSFRGAGSSQSAIMWEGVNIQSPTVGSSDLSQIPISFVDNVTLQYGAGGSLYGSGTIGGSLQISSSQPTFEKQPFSAELLQQVGSFGQSYTGVNVSSSSDRYEIKVRGFSEKAENDFSFYNRFTKEKDRMSNAAIHKQGIMVEPSFKLSEKSKLTGKYWLQDNDVQIPPTAGQGGAANDQQKDVFHRSVVTFYHKLNKGRLKAQSSWLNYKSVYNAGRPTRSNSLISEIQTDWRLENMTSVEVGVNHTFETADVSNYGGLEPTRNQTALFALAKKVFYKKLEVSMSAREVLVDDVFTPIVPALGFNYQLSSFYSLKGKAAQSFRIPTFNDLYWTSGTDTGNPDLVPEKGLNLELGQVVNLGEEDQFNAELTIFSNYVEDWIQWQPNTTGNWRPVNVVEAWLRGIELSSNFETTITNRLRLRSGLHYTYTKATKEKINDDGNPAELGNQLIYVPEHQASFNASLHYQGASFALNQTYTGSQFTTSDNNTRWMLEGYALTNISASYQWDWSKHSLDLSIRVNNVTDKQYEVKSAYPMPGRNYNISLHYNFNSITK